MPPSERSRQSSAGNDRFRLGIFRPGGVGDVFLLAPVLRSLQALPDPPAVHLWGQLDACHIMQYLGLIDTYANLSLGFTMPSGRLDAVVLFDTDPILLHAALMCGVRDVRNWPRVSPDETHQSEYLAWSIKQTISCGPIDLTTPYTIHIPQPAVSDRRPILVHPGSSTPVKNWSVEGFDAVIRMLVRWGRDVQPIGGQHEWYAELGGVPVASLPMLAAAWTMAQAQLYVGNDSGLTHLAAMLGIPTVAIFGPSDPLVWRPLGPRVVVVRRCPHIHNVHTSWWHTGHNCFEGTTPGVVLRAIREAAVTKAQSEPVSGRH